MRFALLLICLWQNARDTTEPEKAAQPEKKQKTQATQTLTEEKKSNKPTGIPCNSPDMHPIVLLDIPPKLLPLEAREVCDYQAVIKAQWSKIILDQRTKKAMGGEHYADLVGLVPVHASCNMPVSSASVEAFLSCFVCRHGCSSC